MYSNFPMLEAADSLSEAVRSLDNAAEKIEEYFSEDKPDWVIVMLAGLRATRQVTNRSLEIDQFKKLVDAESAEYEEGAARADANSY